MAYWGHVVRRAWREAAKTVKLDSRKLLMVLVLGQVVVGLILYFVLGPDKLPDNVVARCATIAAPLLLFVPFFLWEIVLTPAKMHAEQATELNRARAEKESALLANMAAPVARDSIILNLQEENAALKAELSTVKRNTDADYPFDATQRTALVSFLSRISAGARFPVVILHAGLGGDSDYARRMARPFREAGWEVQVYPDYTVQPTNEGVYLATPPDETGQPSPLPPPGRLVQEALEAAGVKHMLSSHGLAGDTAGSEWSFFVFPPSD